MDIQYPSNEAKLPTIELQESYKPHLHYEEIFYSNQVNYNNYVYGQMNALGSQYNITVYPGNWTR